MSQDKNLINQIKYKSTKNVSASQEIPYTALPVLPSITDNTVFSVVESTINYQTTFSEITNTIISKPDVLTITTASDTIEFTIEQLTSYRKIIVDLTSFVSVSEFTIQFPQNYNSSTDLIDIEILYNRVTEPDITLLQVKFFDVAVSTSLGYFVMIPKNNTVFPEINKMPDYKISFSFSNNSIRNPKGIVMAQASSGGTVYGGEILGGGYGKNPIIHSYNMMFFDIVTGNPRFYPTIGGPVTTGSKTEHTMKLGSTITFFQFSAVVNNSYSPVSYGSSSFKSHIIFEGNNSGYACSGMVADSAREQLATGFRYYNQREYWTGSGSDNSITCTSFANPYLVLATGEGF